MSAGQGSLVAKMISSPPASVDLGQVLTVGATAIRDVFPADVVPKILDAYCRVCEWLLPSVLAASVSRL